jgi:hypothetical protein
MKDFFNWLVAALFTVVMLFGGWLYAAQSEKVQSIELTQSTHTIAIAKLEILVDMQQKQNERVIELMTKWMAEDRERHHRGNR